MIIIGSGLLASGFQGSEQDFENNGHVIFASGVSNSQEHNDATFKREINLLIDTLEVHSNKKIIYFSSTSIYNNNKSKYILHKIKIEKIILKKAKKYLILRCPQVVGPTFSKTLVSLFVNKIINGLDLEIQKYATRDLIDVEDVVRLTYIIANLKQDSNLILDISTGRKIPVIDIAEEIASIIRKDLKKILINCGDSTMINSIDLKNYINKNDLIFAEDYWRKVLIKNVPLIIKRNGWK